MNELKLLRADEQVLDDLSIYLPEGQILEQLADFFAVSPCKNVLILYFQENNDIIILEE